MARDLWRWTCEIRWHKMDRYIVHQIPVYLITRFRSIAIDGHANKWIGTENGFVKFDGTTWTEYNNTNSGLPNDFVTSLIIDSNGNKWIGTGSGLAVFSGGNSAIKINHGPALNSLLSFARIFLIHSSKEPLLVIMSLKMALSAANLFP